MKNYISVIVFATLTALLAVSCRNDFDFEEHYNKQSAAEIAFQTSFEEEFGPIAPDQSWDFCSGQTTLATTRAGSGFTVTTTDWYSVDSDVVNYFKDNLIEGENNKNLGSPFVMATPNNEFTIYPVYQGQSMQWDLHVVINGVDKKIWQKGQDIQKKTSEYQVCSTCRGTGKQRGNKTCENCNGTGKVSASWINVGSDTNWNDNGNNYNTTDAIAIQSKGYTISNFGTGETMYFYIELTKIDSGYGTVNQKHTSTGDMMRVLSKCPVPTQFSDKEVLIVGVEDSNTSLTDWDYNDLVLLVVGSPKVPQEIKITEGTYEVNTEVGKRYMVEDLGATQGSDIDFNDIVVDFVERKTVIHDIKKDQYGQITEDTPRTPSYNYSAIVRALGGTKNISLFLSNNSDMTPSPTRDVCIYTKVPETGAYSVHSNVTVSKEGAYITSINKKTMYNTNQPTGKYGDGHYFTGDYLAKINLDNVSSAYKYQMDKNNVYVVVYDEKTNSNGVEAVVESTISFPADGSVPKMIAVDVSQDWNWERTSVFPNDRGDYLEGCNLKLKKLAAASNAAE